MLYTIGHLYSSFALKEIRFQYVLTGQCPESEISTVNFLKIYSSIFRNKNMIANVSTLCITN
jgi:hypothetical protein